MQKDVKKNIQNYLIYGIDNIDLVDQRINELEDLNKCLFGVANQKAKPYWDKLEVERGKSIRKSLGPSDYKWLDLYIKPTINDDKWIGGFSIIWVRSHTIKPKRGITQVISAPIPKGPGYKYEKTKFRQQQEWEREAAIELEEEFSEIRRSVSLISKSRKNLYLAREYLDNIINKNN